MLLLLALSLQQSNLQTELPYYVDTTMGYLWVRVPSVPAGGQVTVYVSVDPSAPGPDPYATFVVFDDFNTDLNTSLWASSPIGQCQTAAGVISHPDQSYVEVYSISSGYSRCDVLLTYTSPLPGNLDVNYVMVFRAQDPNWGGVGSAGWYRSTGHGFWDFSIGYQPAYTERWVSFYVSELGRRLYFLDRQNGTIISRVYGDDYTFLDPTQWYTCMLSVSPVPGTAALTCTQGGNAYTTSISGVALMQLKPTFAAYNWSYTYPAGRTLVDWTYVAQVPRSLVQTDFSCQSGYCAVTFTNTSSTGYVDVQIPISLSTLAPLGTITDGTHLYVSLSPPRTPTTLTLQVS